MVNPYCCCYSPRSRSRQDRRGAAVQPGEHATVVNLGRTPGRWREEAFQKFSCWGGWASMVAVQCELSAAAAPPPPSRLLPQGQGSCYTIQTTGATCHSLPEVVSNSASTCSGKTGKVHCLGLQYLIFVAGGASLIMKDEEDELVCCGFWSHCGCCCWAFCFSTSCRKEQHMLSFLFNFVSW